MSIYMWDFECEEIHIVDPHTVFILQFKMMITITMNAQVLCAEASELQRLPTASPGHDTVGTNFWEVSCVSVQLVPRNNTWHFWRHWQIVEHKRSSQFEFPTCCSIFFLTSFLVSWAGSDGNIIG